MSNVMRGNFTPLTPEQKAIVAEVKEQFENLWIKLDEIGSARELSLAKTKLEESCMWAVKAITS